jgi:hypothetical protein
MKRLLTAVPMLFAAADASAINRYDIGLKTCAEVQSIIQSEGAAILRYRSPRNPSLPLYDRYVRDRSYCQSTEITERAGVPTIDGNYCPVRKCIEQELFDVR